MDDSIGWACVESVAVLSQKSLDSTSDQADALHDTTDSDEDSQQVQGLCNVPEHQAWWAKMLQEATLQHCKRPIQLRSLLLASSCTGSGAEMAVLKDTMSCFCVSRSVLVLGCGIGLQH